MKQLYTLLLLLFVSAGTAWGQPWQYDFGTGTGTANNSNAGSGKTDFFASTPSGGGTYRVRIGTAGGSLVLANPGTSLGTGSETQLTAATSTSTNKFAVHSWDSPSQVGYLKVKLRTTSSGNGNLAIAIGNSTIGTDNNGYTGHYNNSLSSLWITYSSGSLSSVNRRASGSTTSISGSGFEIDTDQELQIFLNNSSTTQEYSHLGDTYSLNTQTWDLWVDGVKISPANGWPKAGTLATGNLTGFGFFAESSTSNAASLMIDDIEYSNSLPLTPTVTISNTGTPAVGDLIQDADDAVLFGFSLTPSASIDFTAVDITTTGTADAGDLSNFRLVYDANDNGVFDGGESVIAIVATLAETLEFGSFSPAQSGVAAERRYLLVADVAADATVGATFTASIAAAGDVATTGDESGTAAGNEQSIISASSPFLSTNVATLDNFGDVAIGSLSDEQTFTVSGDNLTGNVTVTAPTHFQVSLTTEDGFAASVELTQTGGDVDGEPATIFVRLNPASVAGAVSGNVTVASADATTQNVAVSGFVLADEPSEPANTLQFSAITQTLMTISWVRGDGDQVLVLVKSGSAVDSNPVDKTTYTANAAFGSGDEIGTGNEVVFKGTGTSVAVTGLTAGTTYHVKVIEFNVDASGTENYETAGLIGSQVTDEPVDYMALTAIGVAATEDFNTLASTGTTSSTMPQGWFFSEQGTGANTTYAVGTGSSNSGNTYSFGLADDTERALGGLLSGSVTPSFGAKVRNNTGSAIQSVKISYTGETWRVGTADRSDRLDFQYSTDATSLTTGTWTDFDALDYENPGQAIGNGSVQHSETLSAVISHISIANGSSLWIRWNDFDASGADDGMAIDDVSITANVFETSLTGSAGWRMMSMPVTGVTVSDLASQNLVQGIAGGSYSAFSPNLYTNFSGLADGPNSDGWNIPANHSTVLNPGQGFIWYLYNNTNVAESKALPFTFSITGSEPSDDVSVSVHSNGNGFNLVGNPFASSINISSLTEVGGEFASAVVQVWDPSTAGGGGGTSSYVLSSSGTLGGKVAPFQAFLLENSTATSVSIPTSAKTTGGTFLKDVSTRAIEFELQGTQTIDKAAIVYFHPNAVLTWDKWDATKLMPLSGSVGIMAFDGVRNGVGVTQAQKSLPYDLKEAVQIDIQVTASSVGDYVMNWPVLRDIPETWDVVLVDNQTGTQTDLRTAESYMFSHTGALTKSLPDGTLQPLTTAASDSPRFTLLIDPLNTTSTKDDGRGTMDEFALHQNYPNPFNPSTQIRFTLQSSDVTRLTVYDVLGREVAVLVDGVMQTGSHYVNFNASDITSGVYLYKLEAGGQVMTRRMTLIK